MSVGSLGEAGFVTFGRRALAGVRDAAMQQRTAAPIAFGRAQFYRLRNHAPGAAFLQTMSVSAASIVARGGTTLPAAFLRRASSLFPLPSTPNARAAVGIRAATPAAIRLQITERVAAARSTRHPAPVRTTVAMARAWVPAGVARAIVPAPVPPAASMPVSRRREWLPARQPVAPVAMPLAALDAATASRAIADTAAPRNNATACAPDRTDASPRTDGATFARWLDDALAREALRPAAGLSAMDDRLTPVYPGAPIG